ncbi:MAG: serine hydroxymethyltransferase, partial [Holosporaceae bacterium]|nr:serine hydroxymethyltransferase [Holosporaceae bacterium]
QISGKAAELELEKAGITCNKKTIPFDPLPPSQTSGVRLGSAAMTTRGLGVAEFRKIADLIYTVLANYGKANYNDIRQQTRDEALSLCQSFPLY